MVSSSIIMPIFLYLLHHCELKNGHKKNTLSKFEKFCVKFFTKFKIFKNLNYRTNTILK